MAKTRGIWSAFFLQTTSASASASNISLSRVGTTLWYSVASSTYYYWDKAKTITVLDGITPVVPLEIDYAAGAVRLAEVPAGSVTASFYHFACSQFGGFRNFTIDESMELIECGCFEDDGEIYEPGMYSATGSGDGFWSSVDSSLDMNGLTLLAKPIGPAGDDISAECIVSGDDTELSVSVVGNAITINSATGSGGAATSNLRQIRDAIEADADASALVRCRYTTGHDGSEIMGAITEDNLAGGVTPEMLSRFGEDIIAVFFWDSGASLIRTEGLITFEKQSIKTGVKGLVGKTLNFKSQGMLYEHAG
jgi:hypothetical protein